MSQLLVRNVGPEVIGALKRRAVRHGRSAEAEHREILRDALASDLEPETFTDFLRSIPNVGTDEDFVVPRDAPGLPG